MLVCTFVHVSLLLVAAVPRRHSFNIFVCANLSYNMVMLPLTSSCTAMLVTIILNYVSLYNGPPRRKK